MVRRPTGRLWIDTAEPEFAEIEFVNKNVNHPNRIVFINPVVQQHREQSALLAINAFHKTLHQTIPPHGSGES